MLSNNGAKIRRLTAIILVIMSVCTVMPVQAETAATDRLFGEVKNETYENAFLGLGCTLDGWHYYSDEEQEKVNQMTKEALLHELDELIDRNIGIMMAEKPDSRQNVNIQIQNIKNFTAVYKIMGLEYVATSSLDGFKAMLAGAGYTDIQVSVDEVTVGDQTFTGVKGSYKIGSIPAYFKQLWELRDDYMVTVTATTFQTDTTDEVFTYFYLL